MKESGRFQGFARLASESRHDGIPVPWVLPPGFDRRILGGTFKVDWLNRYVLVTKSQRIAIVVCDKGEVSGLGLGHAVENGHISNIRGHHHI